MSNSYPIENIKCRVIDYASEHYQMELQIRDRVLRKPLAMSVYNDDLLVDANYIHIAAFADETMVAVMQLSPVNAEVVKMRQVAVDDGWRGCGVGEKLLKFFEQIAVQEGFKRIVLHARKVAVGFYSKNGYQTYGEEFFEIGIPHYNMFKNL